MSIHEREARCGGTGMVAYWDGSAYAGEMCRGCIDCEPPDAALAPPCDHKFVDSLVCLKCGVTAAALAPNTEEK